MKPEDIGPNWTFARYSRCCDSNPHCGLSLRKLHRSKRQLQNTQTSPERCTEQVSSELYSPYLITGSSAVVGKDNSAWEAILGGPPLRREEAGEHAFTGFCASHGLTHPDRLRQFDAQRFLIVDIEIQLTDPTTVTF